MARFVFRAEAALNLRRQQEQAATHAWVEAAGTLEAARQAAADADHAVGVGLSDGADVHDPGRRAWHRNWIVRLQQQAAERRRRVVACQVAVDAAVARLHAARRDVKALERLRARALSAWQLAERRAEQKEMDWLGSVKYALRMNVDQ